MLFYLKTFIYYVFYISPSKAAEIFINNKSIWVPYRKFNI